MAQLLPPMKTITIISCLAMTGCSLLFEQEAEVPMRDESKYRIEAYCGNVQQYDEDAGKWVKAPYDCKKD